jgi:hypothetical protein
MVAIRGPPVAARRSGVAPGLLVQRATYGIVQGHRSTLAPGLIERFARQYRAGRPTHSVEPPLRGWEVQCSPKNMP